MTLKLDEHKQKIAKGVRLSEPYLHTSSFCTGYIAALLSLERVLELDAEEIRDFEFLANFNDIRNNIPYLHSSSYVLPNS